MPRKGRAVDTYGRPLDGAELPEDSDQARPPSDVPDMAGMTTEQVLTLGKRKALELGIDALYTLEAVMSSSNMAAAVSASRAILTDVLIKGPFALEADQTDDLEASRKEGRAREALGEVIGLLAPTEDGTEVTEDGTENERQ
jgi:hypothetical protein